MRQFFANKCHLPKLCVVVQQTRGYRASRNRVIGINLGTTNSHVDVMEGSSFRIIPNSEGMRTTPSYVAIDKGSGKKLVGLLAKRQAVTNPKDTIYGSKRLIGRTFDDPVTQKVARLMSYEIVKAPNGDAWVNAGGNSYSPSEIGAMILTKMKETAETFLGETVKHAILTVPTYFNTSQRLATKEAGTIAGLEVLRIVNEPTAACLAYSLGKGEGGTIAVFDMGGGTFDITVLEFEFGVFEVKAANGDIFLGGEDFDQVLVEHILAEFKRTEGTDLSNDSIALQRIRDASENAKIELSFQSTTEINLPCITSDTNGSKNLFMTINRAKFEELSDKLINRTLEPCRNCLRDAGVTQGDIDEVILVGGMTHMPKIQRVVRDFFGKQATNSSSPDEMVAMGAVIQGNVLCGDVKDVLLFDVEKL